jgi:hypothetical protein
VKKAYRTIVEELNSVADEGILLKWTLKKHNIRMWTDKMFESRQRLGIFLFTTASRPALVPTQPPIQWVPAALYLGVKRPVR